MKKFLLFLLVFAAICGMCIAQSARKIDAASAKARGSSNVAELPPFATIARGLIDLSDNLLVWATSAGLVFEGATDDEYETTLALTEPTADQTVTLPNATGTVLVSATETVTATNVITASENGSVFFLDSATEFVSTLPSPASGLRFTFIVKSAPSGASYTVVTTSSANVIKGMQLCAADAAGDTGTADDTVSFVDGQAVAGDMVEFWCDGTSWFAVARSRVADGITFTQAS